MELKLSVLPLQSPAPGTPPIETRPKQVKEWLDALPLANSLETSRKLADSLVALNTTKLSEDARFKLLELFSETVRTLLPALQQHYIGRPLPLGDKQQQAANLGRELLAQLANGYKRILTDINQRRIAFGADKLAPVAIRRAIECLGEILDVCYETYGPTPAGVWTETHQLYWYAAANNLQDKGAGENTQRTINTAYKQILLVALIDPYRLLQGQLAQVKAYLDLFGQMASLQPMGPAPTTHGLFLVRLDGDKPPKALAHHSGATDPGTDILLNTVPLARAVHQQIQDLETGTAPKKAGLPDAAASPAYRDLLKRFLKQWGIAPKRMFTRTASDVDAVICTGISSLHHSLSMLEPDISLDVSETENESTITIRVGEPGADTAAHQTYYCAPWQVLNESAGGVSLGKDRDSVTKIKVGDIIGLNARNQPNVGIAVVRWAQSAVDGNVEVGAQLLAPRGEPIAIKPVISAPDAIFQPALLLPQIPALQQPERIIAPRGSFQPMREFEVRIFGETKHVRATKLLEQTDSFELFLFS